MASVNTNDSRLAGIIDERNQMAKEVQGNYDKASGMTNSAYNELIQAAKDYGQQQADIQQQKTDQTLAEIEQEKQKTERDYTKEQKGAYADYVNQTDAYGVNAEKMAAAGLTGSGYEESSNVRMYNAYQNRVAVARQSLNDAITSYNNQKTQAQIANSEALAQIAYQALQTQLQLTIENMQYQNELLNTLTQQKLSVNTSYNQLWQSMYSTLLGESQFNEQMDLQRKQFDLQKQQFEWQKKTASSSGSARRSTTRSSGSDESNRAFTDGSSNYSLEWISDNAVALRFSDGRTATLNLTSDLTDEQKEQEIIKWAKRNGVTNLSN